MDEYIKREKAIASFKWLYNPNISPAQRRMLDAAIKEIKRLQAEDVEPVIHAHWIVDDEYLTCSNCGESYLAGDTRSEVKFLLAHGDVHKRCHECGAHMDEEGEG